LLVHGFITLMLIIYFVAGVNPFRHFRTMSSALLTAFSTSVVLI
jgi:Na+/H+-dicarboxylate symporter